MKTLVWALIAVLTAVHQIDWDFDAQPLFLGVVPPGLLFHAVLSVMASLLWLLAVMSCWPADAEVDLPQPRDSSEANA